MFYPQNQIDWVNFILNHYNISKEKLVGRIMELSIGEEKVKFFLTSINPVVCVLTNILIEDLLRESELKNRISEDLFSKIETFLVEECTIIERNFSHLESNRAFRIFENQLRKEINNTSIFSEVRWLFNKYTF